MGAIHHYCGCKEPPIEIVLFQEKKTISGEELKNKTKSVGSDSFIKVLQKSWKTIKYERIKKKRLNNLKNIIELININIEKNGKFVENQEFFNRMPEKVFEIYSKFYGKEPLNIEFAPMNAYRIKRKPLELFDKNFIYKGQWTPTGKKDGFGSILKLKSLIQGYWNNDILYYGMKIYNNGYYYIGELNDFQANGEGRFYDDKSELIYEGHWKNDKFFGKGKLKASIRNGIGFMFKNLADINSSKDSSIYNNAFVFFSKGEKCILINGEFEDNKLNGRGTLEIKDYVKYEGDFLSNKFNGGGKLQFLSENFSCKEYNGEFNDNQMNGKGIFLWKSGIYFEGIYLNNKKNGMGTYYFKDNTRFQANWTNSRINGNAIFFDKKTKDETLFKFKLGKMVYNANNSDDRNIHNELIENLPNENEYVFNKENLIFDYEYPHKEDDVINKLNIK